MSIEIVEAYAYKEEIKALFDTFSAAVTNHEAKRSELAANEKKNIELSENIPPELKEFFAPEFLEEPEMTMSDTSTPY